MSDTKYDWRKIQEEYLNEQKARNKIDLAAKEAAWKEYFPDEPPHFYRDFSETGKK